jgi:hypothetical protein
MGYKAPISDGDRNRLIWICRYCGGGMAVSKIEYKDGTLKDFENVFPEKFKAFSYI